MQQDLPDRKGSQDRRAPLEQRARPVRKEPPDRKDLPARWVPRVRKDHKDLREPAGS